MVASVGTSRRTSVEEGLGVPVAGACVGAAVSDGAGSDVAAKVAMGVGMEVDTIGDISPETGATVRHAATPDTATHVNNSPFFT